MPEGVSLAQRIRDKLDAGKLPSSAPPTVWAGYGRGNPCDACGEPIAPSQLEHEYRLDDGVTTNCRFHVPCGGVWQAELRHRGLA